MLPISSDVLTEKKKHFMLSWDLLQKYKFHDKYSLNFPLSVEQGISIYIYAFPALWNSEIHDWSLSPF